MGLLTALVLFAAGLALVVYFAEKLVQGTVGLSVGFGVSAFLISVVFIGFDPENLALGGVAAWEGVAGIALGSIVGAAMVAVALAFGVTALLAPMEFQEAPKQIVIVPVAAVSLLFLLGVDGLLSRVDGTILLAAFVASILYLIALGRRGLDIRATGEVGETLEHAGELSRGKALGLFVVSLAAIIAGSEMVVRSSRSLIGEFGLSETVFGMTILALLVSIEELARELPAARRGRSEITYGNVAGSVLAFFLFNAGIIALIEPVPVGRDVLTFYLPVCLLTVILIAAFMLRRKVSRSAGALLVALYTVFFIGGYLM